MGISKITDKKVKDMRLSPSDAIKKVRTVGLVQAVRHYACTKTTWPI